MVSVPRPGLSPSSSREQSSDGSRVFTKSSDYSGDYMLSITSSTRTLTSNLYPVVLDSGSIERRVDEIAKVTRACHVSSKF